MNDATSEFYRPLHHSLVVAIIAAAFALVLAGLQGLGPEAYWWHVAVGEFNTAWRAVPDEQIFNYTVPPEQLWVHTDWLGAVVLATLHDMAGAEFSLLVRNLLLGLTAALVAWTLSRRYATIQAIAVPTSVATGVFLFFVGVEPFVFAMPLAACAVIAAFRLLDHPERFWWALPMPLAILAVINLDFATAACLVAVGVVVAVELLRRSRDADTTARVVAAALIAASGVFCLLGFAYGPTYWATAFIFAFSAPALTESLVVAGLLATGGACLSKHPHRIAAATILVATAVPALFAPSAIPLLAIATALAIAPFFDALDADASAFVPRKRHIATAVVIATLAAALQPGTITRAPVVTALDSDLRTEPPLVGVMGDDRPLRCAEELRRTGSFPRVYHERADAGFLLYHLLDPEQPHIPLFDDPRSLTPSDELLRAHEFHESPADLTFFEDRGIDAVVVPRHDYPALVEALEAADDWYDLRPHDDGPYTCFFDTSPAVTNQ